MKTDTQTLIDELLDHLEEQQTFALRNGLASDFDSWSKALSISLRLSERIGEGAGE